MSDDALKHFEAQQGGIQEQEKPSRSFTLLITMHSDGKLDITGPIGDDLLCYGMLEKARSQIQKLHLLADLKQTQAKPGGIGGLLKRMNGGG